MTIINPKKNKLKISLLLTGLIFLILVMAYWSISLYNQTVDLKYALSSTEENFQNLKSFNADIKHQLYLLTESKNLTRLGEERGLVKTEVNSWSIVSVSQL